MHDGDAITTIEGLGSERNLSPMQQAFVDHDAYQCGYCTPGQICSAVGMLKEGHVKTEADVREQMSGNVCRCGAYPGIVAAVRHIMATSQTEGARRNPLIERDETAPSLRTLWSSLQHKGECIDDFSSSQKHF